MRVTEIVSLLCLIYMVGVVCFAVAPFFKADGRKERFKLLSNFKKGKFLLIYFATVPLYWLAHVFNGTPVGGAFLMAVKSSIDTIVLKFDYSSASALMAQNAFFRAVIDIGFVLITVNAVVFTVALVGQRTYNFILTQAAYRGKKIYFIIGSDERSIDLLASVDRDAKAVLLGDGSKSLLDAAFFVKRPSVRLKNNDDIARFIIQKTGDVKSKKIYVIINSGDDARNLLLCEQISRPIVKLNGERPDSETGIFAYVFGAPENKSAFLHFSEKTKGRLRYIDKYKLVADAFSSRNPMTSYMTDREINYDDATVRPDVDLGFVMIGFGRTNRRIFLNAVADNQFLTRGENGLEVKPVVFSIFDKVNSQNDKNLNHSYFRYRNTLKLAKGREDEYLPLPPEPAVTDFFKLDINDSAFYFRLRERLLPQEGRKAFNFVVVGFGNDLENLDLADKISAKLREWRAESYTRLFVKIRNGRLSREVVAKEYGVANDFITFGEEDCEVYDVAAISAEPEEKMAWRRHLAYTAESKQGVPEEEVVRAALDKWYGNFRQFQRDTNVSACMNLRTKLNLLGYDYVSADSPQKDESENFFMAYQKDDPIRYTGTTVGGKKGIEYRNSDFSRDSVRHTFAVQEHQRWNACMISGGVVPSTRAQIADPQDGGRRLDLRRHGCITTFDGLVEYRKLIAASNGGDEESADVIRYDYQIMDESLWLLAANGYKVVKKALLKQKDDKETQNQ